MLRLTALSRSASWRTLVVVDEQGYYFVTPPGPRDPGLEAFETWLAGAMRAGK